MLTSDQAKYIHKKVEKDTLINIETIKHKIEKYKLDEEMVVRRKINDFEKKIMSILIHHKWSTIQYLIML